MSLFDYEERKNTSLLFDDIDKKQVKNDLATLFLSDSLKTGLIGNAKEYIQKYMPANNFSAQVAIFNKRFKGIFKACVLDKNWEEEEFLKIASLVVHFNAPFSKESFFIYHDDYTNGLYDHYFNDNDENIDDGW